ncbi:hypothetical protein DPMN_116758 [Dreissena polymorpha]|uniref:Uncharacterized protein n=1 Tax=Dreissena polymorpha TaxID=45954 RepID=A0A9D4KNL4_DREPO|nr:hypothetical protein DPMN_116758 [Dreissena polymorpha]
MPWRIVLKTESCLVTKPSQLSSFNGRKLRLLGTNKCCSPLSDVLVCLVLRVGNAEQSSDTFMFECLYHAFCVRVKRPGLAAKEYDGDYEGRLEHVLGKLMEQLVHNMHSLAIAAVAMAIFIRTSAALVPSLNRVAPKYLKLVTSSSFLLFMVMCALMLVMLFTMVFDFPLLTSIPYAPALS